MIHYETQTLDLADEDRVQTAVVGLRYTGVNSTASPQRPRDYGGWPGRSSFQGGSIAETDDEGAIREREPGNLQIGIVPDTIDGETVDGGSLSGLENLSDFEVIYDPEAIATAILEDNYLPPDAFGGERTSPNYDVRERLFDHLKTTTDGRHRWLRNCGSTATSQLLDTVVFIVLGFGVFPALGLGGHATTGWALVSIVAGQYVVKLGVAALDTIPFYIVTEGHE